MSEPETTEAILLIDDDISLLPALSAALSSEGYNVIEATNHREIDIPANTTITHIITDNDNKTPTGTPDYDAGLEFIEQVREGKVPNIAPNTPIALISADRISAKTGETLELAAGELCASFKQKPLRQADIQTVVEGAEGYAAYRPKRRKTWSTCKRC